MDRIGLRQLLSNAQGLIVKLSNFKNLDQC